MAAVYNSRDIVEDYLRSSLLHSGLQARGVLWRRCGPDAQHRHNATVSTSSWRSAMTSHRGLAPKDPCLATPQLQVVLRCAGDELQQRYPGNLAAHASVLLPCDVVGAERRRGLTVVREELFRDGVNWGRIVAMMELGGALCTEVVQKGEPWQVDDIADWMEESLDSPPLRGWIEDNGGWHAFVQLYGGSTPPVRSWSLTSLFGLAVLGAALVTLGALLTQQ